MKNQKSVSTTVEPKKGPNIEVVHRIMARVAEWMEETGRTTTIPAPPQPSPNDKEKVRHSEREFVKTKKQVKKEAVQS